MRISSVNKNGVVPDHHATQTSPVPIYPQTHTISTNTSPIPPAYSSLSQKDRSTGSHLPPTSTSANSSLPVNKQAAKIVLNRVLGDAIGKVLIPTSPPQIQSSTQTTSNSGGGSIPHNIAQNIAQNAVLQSMQDNERYEHQNNIQNGQNSQNNSFQNTDTNSSSSQNLYQRKYPQTLQKPGPSSAVHSPIPPLSISTQNINVIGGSKRISQDLPNKLQHSTSYVDNSTKDQASFLQHSTPALHQNFSGKEQEMGSGWCLKL